MIFLKFNGLLNIDICVRVDIFVRLKLCMYICIVKLWKRNLIKFLK